MEEETATRLDLVDMLRTQVLELEREKRDVIRRYDEQVNIFGRPISWPGLICIFRDCHF